MSERDTPRALHTVAMYLAQDAAVHDQRGTIDPNVTRIMRREAARLERMAIAEVDRYVAETGENPEPTREILTISAISLEHYPCTEDAARAIYAKETDTTSH